MHIRKETNADVKERILLVRRVRIEGHEASKIAEKELHKSRGGGPTNGWIDLMNTD